MAERIAFRGLTPSELAKKDMKDYMPMITSRERRTIKRNGLEYRQLIEKVNAHIASKSTKAIRTTIREAVILPHWVGLKFEVHNGKEWKPVYVTAAMLNHRLGQYSHTTKRVIHSDPGIRATRGSKFLAMK
jgi:small subunit ribosomal protein S19